MNMMRWPCLCEGRAQAPEPSPSFHFPTLPGKAEVHGHPMDSQVPPGAAVEALGPRVGEGKGV